MLGFAIDIRMLQQQQHAWVGCSAHICAVIGQAHAVVLYLRVESERLAI